MKRLLLPILLGLSLFVTVPVLAEIEEIGWIWQAGIDACTWSGGCNAAGLAIIPESDQSSINLPVSCARGTLHIERDATVTRTLEIHLGGTRIAARDIDQSTSLSVSGINSTTLTLANNTPYVGELYIRSVLLTCEPDYPDIEGLMPIPIEIRPTPFRKIRIMDVWDYWGLGRMALTVWNFLDQIGYNRTVIALFVLMPVAIMIVYNLLHKPPDV